MFFGVLEHTHTHTYIYICIYIYIYLSSASWSRRRRQFPSLFEIVGIFSAPSVSIRHWKNVPVKFFPVSQCGTVISPFTGSQWWSHYMAFAFSSSLDRKRSRRRILMHFVEKGIIKHKMKTTEKQSWSIHHSVYLLVEYSIILSIETDRKVRQS